MGNAYPVTVFRAIQEVLRYAAVHYELRSSVIFLLVFLASGTIWAQTATLRGVVSDESGALVPKAKVTISGPGGAAKSVTADDRGAYSFSALPPGDYKIKATAPQLATLESAITLQSGVQDLNLQMKVVTEAEQVTVQENTGPTVSTEVSNNASALVLRGDDLQALSDDPDDLMADLQALAGPSAGPNGGSIFIDGFSGGELPPKDSIREVRINSNPFAPEFDKLGFGRIEIFTKPGTDHFHGTFDHNYATDAWNSRNPYSAVKAPFLLNENEGNMAGPINKRTSFTLDGQQNNVDNGYIINAVTVDPQTLAIQPFFNALRVPQRFTRFSPRIDYQLNPNNTLVFRYTVTDVDVNPTGVGAFDLASRGYDFHYRNQTLHLTETAVLGTAINETRFQYFRAAPDRTAKGNSPQIQVLGAFTGGSAPVGQSFDVQNNYEVQNYTTISRGAHVWKFGVRLRGAIDDNISPQNFNGTFTFGGGYAPILDANFQPVTPGVICDVRNPNPACADITSIQRYQRTLAFQKMGLSPAAIRQLGGGATQFSINAGTPGLSVGQVDVGAFLGDDWRVRQNITLSLGLRYETQTNIHDWRDFAPRIAVAWAPGAKNKKPKTVLRAGFGTFYDRFALSNTLTAQRFNGRVQQQFVITNPDFFPSIPTLNGLQATPQVVQEISSNLRAPYILQSSVTVERQLPANTTLAVTYTNSRGLHILRSNDINAPLPGSFLAGVPGSGVFPFGEPNPLFLMESSGIYKQNQLITNVNARINPGLSLFGFYVLNKAMSSSDGLGTFPANPYNFSGEFAPASADIRHRATLGGSINTRWNIRLSPFVTIQSGPPFDITAGSDLFGTTLFNGRPGIATDPTKPGVIQTPYGLLDPNPAPGERILPRNFGRGPGSISVNLRLGKTWGFGAERGDSGGSGRGGGGSPVAMAGGRGLGSIIGPSTTKHRYNLSVSMSARNVLNHTNPGPIIGNITSPLFGQANQSQGGLNGEGFSENADNRRLELQCRFTF
jgi:carboxypeptidase family protein